MSRLGSSHFSYKHILKMRTHQVLNFMPFIASSPKKSKIPIFKDLLIFISINIIFTNRNRVQLRLHDLLRIYQACVLSKQILTISVLQMRTGVQKDQDFNLAPFNCKVHDFNTITQFLLKLCKLHTWEMLKRCWKTRFRQ